MSENTRTITKVSNEPIPIKTSAIIRTVFNRTRDCDIVFTEPSMTQQQFAEDCDLNNIVDKNFNLKDPSFVTKLQLSSGQSKREPIYGDFSGVSDYQSALNLVKTANEQFYSLPSKVRDRFSNDPQKLLEFCEDPANYDEGVKLGIYQSKAEQLHQADLINSVNSEHLSVSNTGNAGQQAVSGQLTETSAQSST